MKVYHVNPDKSKISWKSQIGDLKINGDLKAKDGSFTTELDEVVGGNVNIDLDTVEIVDSSLSDEDQKKLSEHLQSSDLLEKGKNVVDFKIQEIVPKDGDYKIKGMLNFNNNGFGMDMNAKIQQSEGELHAKGNILAGKSNLQFLNQLEHIFEEQIKGDKSIKTFEITCDIVAQSR